MDEQAQIARTEMFLRITQGRGKQQVFGSGDPKKVPQAKRKEAKS